MISEERIQALAERCTVYTGYKEAIIRAYAKDPKHPALLIYDLPNGIGQCTIALIQRVLSFYTTDDFKDD